MNRRFLPGRAMSNQLDRIAAFEKVFELFLPRGTLRSLLSRSATGPSKAELLKLLEGVDYRTRLYQMIRLGAEASKHPAIQEFISSLEGGDFSDRSLALSSVYGSKDGTHVLRALQDPSRSIRESALSLVSIACSDDQCFEILRNAKEISLRSLIRNLSRRGRRIPIETFLSQEKETNPSTFASYAAYASRQYVDREWEFLAPLLSPDLWSRLARQHPDLATRKLGDILEKTESFEPRVLVLANSVLRVIAKCQPELTLKLTRALLRIFPLNMLEIQGVVPYKTSEVASLLLAQETKGTLNLAPHLWKLDIGQVSQLLDRNLLGTAQLGKWLKRSSPASRDALFLERVDAWKNSDGTLSVELLGLFSKNIRRQYGSELFRALQLQARPEKRLPYIQLLPWEEALAAAQPFLADPDASLRALALAPLITSIRYSRESVSDMLGLVLDRRFEQDPVRMVMLQGLAGLPPTIWQPSHFEALQSIFRHSLDAKDLSSQSLFAIHRLLLRLMPFHFERACSWIVLFMKERTTNGMASFEGILTEKRLPDFVSWVLPVLKSWTTRENEQGLLRFASLLGKRLRHCPDLLALLENLAEKASNSNISESALSLIQSQGRPRMNHLVPRLLKSDPSWSLRHVVITFLHEQRQDLLTPYLGQQSISGKFSTGKTRVVPNFSSGFERWTSAQRKIYRDSVTEMTKDLSRPTGDFFYALRILASLPEPPLQVLLGFARSRSAEHSAVRDFAIDLLASLDGAEGTEELFLCLEDERARTAIYALRKAIDALPTDRALSLLRDIPRRKASIFKETIRLIGELKTREALLSLIEIAGDSPERDIRIALLRALWNFLNEEKSWEVFQKFAQFGDPPIALHLSRIPFERLNEPSRQRFLILLQSLMEVPDTRLRVSLLDRIASLRTLDENFVLRDSVLRSLHSSNADEFAAAARCIVSLYAVRSPSLFTETATELLARKRNLSSFVFALMSEFQKERNVFAPAVRSVLTALSSDNRTSSLQASLRVAAFSWEEIKSHLLGPEFPDSLHVGSISAYISALQSASERVDAMYLDELEKELALSSSEVVRRLGLATLIGAAGGNRGWTEERLHRLRTYREDPSHFVSEAAQFTFPPTEE